jgi:glycosyltransferase involved in cell wall biosynthesis
MSEYRPFITVHIATYNYPEVLACAIQSVLQQTYTHFELLVTGDGCDEDTAACIAAFDDPRISYVNLPENHGAQSHAQNAGLARAKGEWIALLAHDDIWHPTHLESLVRAAEADPACEFFFTFMHEVLPGEGENGRTRSLYGLAPDGVFEPSVVAPPSSWMHRRHVVQNVGGWRPWQMLQSSTDYDVLLRVWASGVRIQNVPALTVYKFSASMRDKVYQTRTSAEQKHMLARMAAEPDFLYREAMLMPQSLSQPSYPRLQRDLPASLRSPGELMRRYLRRRGLPEDYALTVAPDKPLIEQINLMAYFNFADDITPLASRESLHRDRKLAEDGLYLGYGWRNRERDIWGRPFRWARNGAEIYLSHWQGKSRTLGMVASLEGRRPRLVHVHVQDTEGNRLGGGRIFHDSMVRVNLRLPAAQHHVLKLVTTADGEKSRVGDGLVVMIRDLRLE